MQEARLYSKSAGQQVVCHLCAHQCTIKNGSYGLCRVRQNLDGVLYSLVYGHLVAENTDPIEKKPIFHVLPGSRSYSISTVGCNFRCRHCQNFSISKEFSATDIGRGRFRKPDQVVTEALAYSCKSISYTYVEPTIFFEFACDCARQAQAKGIKNIFVSNGYMTGEAARSLASLLDAINIDIKAFSDSFYHKICGAHLQPVLDSVQRMVDLGVWVEITTLIIPGLNDDPDELQRLAAFIAAVNPAIPWHVTAFYPTYKMLDRPPTPPSTLKMARDIGLQAGLKYVYEGNVRGEGGENTFCPSCGIEVISRRGFSISNNSLVDGACPGCGCAVDGVWE